MLPLSNIFRRRRTAYQQFFDSANGKIILADLARVCHARSQLRGQSTDETLVNVGHHEIWQHIQAQINMTNDQLNQLVADEQRLMEDYQYE